MFTDTAIQPTFLCVSLPADDDDFREHVAEALDVLGPDIHRQAGGPAGLLLEISDLYPAAGLQPVIMAAAGAETPRQVWWYVHRDGAPAIVA